MADVHHDDAESARARQLRERIERLRRPPGPGKERSSSVPMSPREFTDAAARATREADSVPEGAQHPDAEAGGEAGLTDGEA
jgi:hypothetical protein